MAENSSISWTDHTFNPWMGCTKVSEGCAHCYAERDMDKRFGKVQWGPNGTRVLTSDENWGKPHRWNRKAAGRRPRVFCASLADVFEDWDGPILDHHGNELCKEYVDSPPKDWKPTEGNGDFLVTMNDVRRRLFALIDMTPYLDWLLLTKRPENILKMWPYRTEDHGQDSHPKMQKLLADSVTSGDRTPALRCRPNVWLGCTVENQEQAEKRIPELLKCSHLAPVLFLSCEPLLGPVDLRSAFLEYNGDYMGDPEVPGGMMPVADLNPKVDWVIAGGESRNATRPSHPDWFRSLRDQCAAADVPFHFKQWGEWRPPIDGDRHEVVSTPFEDRAMALVGTKASGRELDGVVHDAYPSAASAVGDTKEENQS